jgi:putative spermidine/putrescine transport system substrate-binding protein
MKKQVKFPSRARVVVCLLVVGLSVGAATAAAKSHGGTKVAATKQLQGSFTFYSGGDVNIQDLWTKMLIPEFQKQYPGIKIKYVFSSHGDADIPTMERVTLAVNHHQPGPYALLESATTAVTLAARQGLFIPVSANDIPNVKNVPPTTLKLVKNGAVPYRGSKVVLAYNSDTVKNPPKTLDQIIAWIKANPGKFAYCNPSDGGSGQFFVQAVLDRFMPAAASLTLAFTDNTALEKYWDKGMATLHAINGDVYGNGTYPTGNTQVLQLLGSGAVDMATVWSDQSLQALKSGQLPKSVKVTNVTPQFAGGATYLGIPKYTSPETVKLVNAFLNFVLAPHQQAQIVDAVAGFPAINLSQMPESVKKDFAATGITMPVPAYSAKITADEERIWQKEVP